MSSRIDEIVKQQAAHSALFDSHDSYKIVQRSEIRKMLNSIDYLLSQLKDGGAKNEIWHKPDEEMPAHVELIAVHGDWLTFSIGDKRELEIVNRLNAWTTRKELVQSARDQIATAPTETSARCGELGVDTAFPLSETLRLLVEWAQHLHVSHECDCNGWEQRWFLVEAAQRYRDEIKCIFPASTEQAGEKG